MTNTGMLLKNLKEEVKSAQKLIDSAADEVLNRNWRMQYFIEAYANRRDSALLKIDFIRRHEEKQEPYNRTSRAYEIWCKEKSIISEMRVK